jgi:hypothetical protein
MGDLDSTLGFSSLAAKLIAENRFLGVGWKWTDAGMPFH